MDIQENIITGQVMNMVHAEIVADPTKDKEWKQIARLWYKRIKIFKKEIEDKQI